MIQVAKLLMKMRPKLASENEVLALESFLTIKIGNANEYMC